MIGDVVLHYKILEKLGGGGMGIVYRAEDTRLRRIVALKFLPPHLTHDDEAKTRFIHEAQAASALDHPNICNIHDINQTKDGQLFICMTLYQGQTLKKIITQKEDLPLDKILSIAAQLASGLNCAHQSGLIHRDLKPANIMITKNDEVKILDFGLAKLVGLTDITKEGSLLGTAAYMSPEQTRGETLDVRTDIWSYGVILYELLSGEPPFKGDYEQAIIYSILNEDPIPIDTLYPDIPKELKAIINRCLQKNADDRHYEINDILEIFNDFFQQVTPTTHIYKPKKTKSRSALKKYVLPLIVIILVAIAMSLWDFLFALPDDKHLIILPFKSINETKDEQIYSAGLTELLTSRLTQLIQFNSSLQVIPADIIKSMDDINVTDAYDNVGATLAITGSVDKTHNLTQLTLNLIDTRSIRQLDSEIIRIDHNLVDSRMEEALINEVATMLELDIPKLLKADFFAVSSNRQDAFDYYVQGCGYLEKFEDSKNIDTAIRFFNQALDSDLNFTLAHAGLGRAFWIKYEETRDTSYVSPAMEACQKAMELNGHYPESYLTCGTIYTGIGEYENAIKKLERAIELDPAYAQAYWKLGETYQLQGDSTRAIQTYKKAIDLRPGYWQGYSRLGKFYLFSGQYKKAKEQYQRVTDLLPNSERGYSFLAIANFYMENIEEAIRMAEKATHINPSYDNLHNLASFNYYDGNFLVASDQYKKVLKYNNTDHRIWGALGMAYHFTDRLDSAKMYFRKAIELVKGELEINPRHQVNLVCLAGYDAHLEQREEAFQCLQKVERMDTNKLDIFFDIGDVYEQLGEREKALLWMEKALKSNYSLVRFTNNPGLKDLMTDNRFQKMLTEYKR